MYLHSNSFRPRSSCGAFTLVEMLVVVAIIAILAAISIPSITGMMRAYQLDTTSQLIINQLNLARQEALSSSHVVEVRLYCLPDYNQSSTTAPTVYRGMQCFTEGNPPATGAITTTALTKPIFFPTPVIIINSITQSPLLSINTNAADAAHPLPTYLSNYTYAVFYYKPDGSTNLTTTTNSVTLMLENTQIVANSLPANYQSIQIDPLIGTVRIFRP